MAWRFREFVPQKARGRLVESIWSDPMWIAEEKYDGERRIAQFCGKVVRFTGTPSRVTGKPVEKTEQVPQLSGWFDKKAGGVPLPDSVPPASLDGTVLDGELIMPEDVKVDGGGSKYVTAISNSSPEEAVRKQMERGWLRYVVFDCLFYKGKDVRELRLDERRCLVAKAMDAWVNPFTLYSIADFNDAKRAWLDDILAGGGEGVILKRRDHKYGDERGWVKVKGEWTADVVIMGFEDAKETSRKVNGEVSMTKYAAAGLIGAIRCGQKRPPQHANEGFIEIATVSGMTDELRKDFTNDPKAYIGRVIEIKHNGREPTGRFRHPRFKRFRSDKRPEDCVYREEEEV
jgi:ATP-dependent DNA ligase